MRNFILGIFVAIVIFVAYHMMSGAFGVRESFQINNNNLHNQIQYITLNK